MSEPTAAATDAHLRADAPAVVRVQELRKSFGGAPAVDGLSFEVRRGECFGLLGPNGAGKSTTLKLVLGLLDPDGGEIRLLGMPIPAQARRARARVGVVPQADSLDPDFTVTENLIVYGRYFGLDRATLERRIPQLLEFSGLAAKSGARIDELSGGMKRRLTIARALVNDPEILFLDEPTTGLDPQARHLIWDRLRSLVARGKTIVLTTHFMEEAERLCSRLAVVDHGRLVLEGEPMALIAREIEPHVVEVTGDGLEAWIRANELPRLCTRSERVGETLFGYCAEPAAMLAAASADPSLRVVHRRATLEDVFLKLTGRELRD
jgi:lipooligosaccharide transport system ATP-binding protein